MALQRRYAGKGCCRPFEHLHHPGVKEDRADQGQADEIGLEVLHFQLLIIQKRASDVLGGGSLDSP